MTPPRSYRVACSDAIACLDLQLIRFSRSIPFLHVIFSRDGASGLQKTTVLLAAIPSTSPYSREGVLRVACPSMFEKPAGNSEHGATGDGAKKVYKRARRRDILPAKRAESTNGNRQKNNVGPSSRAITGACEAPIAGAVEDGRRERKEGETGAGREDDSMDLVRGGIARVSIANSDPVEEKQNEESSKPSLSTLIRPEVPSAVPVASSSVALVGGRPPGMEASAAAAAAGNVKSLGGAAVISKEHSSVTRSSDWGNVSFVPKSGPGSTVALHAMLAAAAAARPSLGVVEASSVASPALVAPTAASSAGPIVASPTVVVVTAPSQQQSESSPKIKPGGDQTRTTHESTTGSGVQQGKMSMVSLEPQSHSNKKGVSFAAGTKASPPDTAALTASLLPRRTGLGTGVGSAGPGRGAGTRGRGRGNAKGSTGKPKPMHQKPKAVLGAVMEKTPAVPIPMMHTGSAGAGQSTGSEGGRVEGHLPRIQADLSFRVMPRGYEKDMKQDDDNGDGDGDDMVRAAGCYKGGEQENGEDSNDESEELGETDGEDDDENDR